MSVNFEEIRDLVATIEYKPSFEFIVEPKAVADQATGEITGYEAVVTVSTIDRNLEQKLYKRMHVPSAVPEPIVVHWIKECAHHIDHTLMNEHYRIGGLTQKQWLTARQEERKSA